MTKKIRVLWWSLGALLVVSSGAILGGSYEMWSAADAQDAQGPVAYPNYPKVGVRTGIHNDGQAALWDLNIIDHFHWFGPEARARGYQPQQPIKFSHITHVQKNGMDCRYCHWTVQKSGYAVIPEVETCMGCHRLAIGGRTPDQQAEIKKVRDAYTAGKPIEWVKVHVVPDYVKFPHQRHVKAGVACQECHGQIPEMEVVQRVSSMKMGWCIDCHRQRGTTIDCVSCHY